MYLMQVLTLIILELEKREDIKLPWLKDINFMKAYFIKKLDDDFDSVKLMIEG